MKTISNPALTAFSREHEIGVSDVSAVRARIEEDAPDRS
jgi:hypothetical protein